MTLRCNLFYPVLPTILWLMIIASPWPRCAEAQSMTPTTIKDVRVGLAGKYKLGFWTPLRVTLASGPQGFRGSLELTVSDSEGLETVFDDGGQIEVPAGDEATFERYIKIGCLGSQLTVRLRDEQGGDVTSDTFSLPKISQALPSTAEYVITVGHSIGAKEAVQISQRRRGDGQQWESSLLKETSLLPEKWWGYEGVDTLVITTGRVNSLSALSPRQFEALELWVRMGGRLVLCVGSRGAEIFGPESRFQSLAPGKFEYVLGLHGVRPLSDTPGLMTLAGVNKPLDNLKITYFSEAPRKYVFIDEQFDVNRGDRRSGETSVPTILRKPLGFGHVVLVAFDLEEPPISSWPGRTRLVERILRGNLDDHVSASEENRPSKAAQIGYDDLTGQLRAALDHYRGVPLMAFSLVAGLIVIYALLIGPGDYFFLQKIVRNMQWTWLSFTLIVVGFCTLAFFLSGTWKGQRVHVNQVDLVDIDLSESRSLDSQDNAQPALIRGVTWTSVYSPQADLYNLSYLPRPLGQADHPASVLFSWQGLPGEGLGGMHKRSISSLFTSPYTININPQRSQKTSPALDDLPIAASSSRSLSCRWWGQTQIGSVGKMIVRHYAGKIDDNPPEGEIRNPLDVELSDCVLYYGRSAYILDRHLAPGESFELLGDVYPPSIERRLKRIQADGTLDRPTAWDPLNRDVPRIMEMIMFHKAAKGSAYTHLSHRYQDYLDMSDHLAMGRAILTGRAETPAGLLLRDGKPQTEYYDSHWTFYRIVIPVERIELESR